MNRSTKTSFDNYIKNANNKIAKLKKEIEELKASNRHPHIVKVSITRRENFITSLQEGIAGATTCYQQALKLNKKVKDMGLTDAANHLRNTTTQTIANFSNGKF